MRCAECGDFFTLAYRTNREMQAAGRSPICSLCRKPALVRPTKELQKWWENRFAAQELVFFAESLWGPREDWGPRETWVLSGVNSLGLRDTDS